MWLFPHRSVALMFPPLQLFPFPQRRSQYTPYLTFNPFSRSALLLILCPQQKGFPAIRRGSRLFPDCVPSGNRQTTCLLRRIQTLRHLNSVFFSLPLHQLTSRSAIQFIELLWSGQRKIVPRACD